MNMNNNLKSPRSLFVSIDSLPAFFILTFPLSWALWFASGVFTRPVPTEIRDFPWLIAQFGVFMPSLVALLISSIKSRQRSISLAILFGIFLPVSLLGVWIASAAPNKILELENAQAILVGIAALGIILFFSPMNRRMANWGLAPQEISKRVGWILLSVIFFPALFMIAWTLASSSSGVFTITVLNGSLPKVLGSVTLIFAFNLISVFQITSKLWV